MKLKDYIDVEKMTGYVLEGLITLRIHPTLPLSILNYSPAAQSVKDWDDTLSKCRGLIFDHNTMDICAIPFPKFWNYNDERHPETLPQNLPKYQPTFYEKVDGSLGIGFWYKNQFILATRGSFESDQAKWAQQWIDIRINNILMSKFDEQFTFLFEIVYPQDRKVVNYQDSGLVLLGAINNNTGLEYNPESVMSGFRWIKGIRCAVQEEFLNNIETIANLDLPNEEGYVAVWYGFKTFRIKIKFETYKKLHRMYFQTSSDVIWELMKTGKLEEYIDQIEDEPLKNWIHNKYLEISAEKTAIEEEVNTLFINAVESVDSRYLPRIFPESIRRKEFAARATTYDHPQLMFLLWDNNLEKFQEALWKIVRPRNSFFRKEDDN